MWSWIILFLLCRKVNLPKSSILGSLNVGNTGNAQWMVLSFPLKAGVKSQISKKNTLVVRKKEKKNCFQKVFTSLCSLSWICVHQPTRLCLCRKYLYFSVECLLTHCFVDLRQSLEQLLCISLLSETLSAFPNYIVACSGTTCSCKWLDLWHGCNIWLMLQRILSSSIWETTSFHYSESWLNSKGTFHSFLKYIWFLNFGVSYLLLSVMKWSKNYLLGFSVCDETELNNLASHLRNISTYRIVFIEVKLPLRFSLAPRKPTISFTLCDLHVKIFSDCAAELIWDGEITMLKLLIYDLSSGNSWRTELEGSVY